MALNKSTAAKEPVTFENGDDSPIDTQEQETAKPSAADRMKAAAAAHAAEQPEEKPASAERAVTSSTGNKVAIPLAKANPYTALENAFPVDFNTFPQIQAKQGSFIYRDGAVKLGDEISLELMSTQEVYALSPGDIDNEESKAFLRYSKDGITAENGDDMQEVLAAAKDAGFLKAKIQHRIVIVGSLTNDGKANGKLLEKIVQLDLAPTSFQNWKRHQANTAFQVQKGKLDPNVVNTALLVLKAEPKEANNMSWTEVVFELQGK